jgi:hypothetical protein
VRFRLEQHLAVSPDAAARAFADPAFYETVGTLPNLAPAEVLSHRAEGDVHTLRIRYRFVGQLSSAVRAVVDPARLTWVEESVHDVARRRTRFTLRADHYADRFDAGGTYEFDAARDPESTIRIAEGSVTIRFPLVGGRVEAAIVSGLRDHLDAEVGAVEAFAAGQS